MLKAYRLNDCEAWAGETLEDAIALAMSQTGCTREEVFDDCYSDESNYILPNDTTGVDEDGSAVTVEDILKAMETNGPGLVWAWD